MRILDVGCGEGTLVRLLEQAGAFVYGVDLNGDAVRVAQHPRITQAQAEDLPFASGSFDLCVSSHLIEHLESPHNFLRECARVVRNHGRVVLIYPWELFRGFTLLPDVVFSGRLPRPSLLQRIHRHRVNPERLRKFTNGTGLKHEHSRMFLGLPNLSFQYVSVLAK